MAFQQMLLFAFLIQGYSYDIAISFVKGSLALSRLYERQHKAGWEAWGHGY